MASSSIDEREYCVVDVETTGGFGEENKITEIAMIVVKSGDVIEEFSTLVNPERSIPLPIIRLTGIDDSMVQDAPKFYEIAKRVLEVANNRIFVAHNVSFDYNVIRNEFKSLGGDFKQERICTVKLSRQLIPGLRSYSLGKLCDNIGISISDRHRALGDTKATVELLRILSEKKGFKDVVDGYLQDKNRMTLPSNLSASKVDGLPEKPGVYYFHDEHKQVIYVGKAVNIKKRVLSHFSGVSGGNKKMRFMRDICDISCEVMGNELIALLYESDEIKRLSPKFNRAQKRTVFNIAIHAYKDQNGYYRMMIEKNSKMISKPLATFSSQMHAINSIRKKASEFELCPKLCNLQKSTAECFDFRIHQCKGACIKKESPDSYNERFAKAFFQKSLDDLADTFVVKVNGRNKDEVAIVLVEEGVYKGFGFIDNSSGFSNLEEIKQEVNFYADNQDVRRIIAQYLKSKKKFDIIELS